MRLRISVLGEDSVYFNMEVNGVEYDALTRFVHEYVKAAEKAGGYVPSIEIEVDTEII
jgi:hypothetical protein